jgi:hypothetical protein
MPQYVSLLHSGKNTAVANQVAALKKKLSGVTLRDRYADNDIEKLEDDAEDFAGDSNCLVIIAGGGTIAAVVAQQVTERQDDNPKKEPPLFSQPYRTPARRA